MTGTPPPGPPPPGYAGYSTSPPAGGQVVIVNDPNQQRFGVEDDGCWTCLKWFAVVFVSPIAVLMHRRSAMDAHVWINLILYLIFWLPGVIHAAWVICALDEIDDTDALGRFNTYPRAQPVVYVQHPPPGAAPPPPGYAYPPQGYSPPAGYPPPPPGAQVVYMPPPPGYAPPPPPGPNYSPLSQGPAAKHT